MDRLGIVVHITGQDASKRDRLVSTLGRTLRDRDHSLVELLEQRTRETLALTDDDLLACVIGWASELLASTGVLVLVSGGAPLDRALARLPSYSPAIELAVEGEFVTSASQRLRVTAEVPNLPQEIAQVILILETEITGGQEASLAGGVANDDVYSAEEEALVQEHLRSLGYL